MRSVSLLQLESRNHSCFLGKLVIGKAPVERKVDSASHWIDLYPLDSAEYFGPRFIRWIALPALWTTCPSCRRKLRDGERKKEAGACV